MTESSVHKVTCLYTSVYRSTADISVNRRTRETLWDTE